eukprot:m.105547 g.105547  ORF g.105547 m.105547 type:complete len:85 (+) comp27658_c0_seq1:32-286(+)
MSGCVLAEYTYIHLSLFGFVLEFYSGSVVDDDGVCRCCRRRRLLLLLLVLITAAVAVVVVIVVVCDWYCRSHLTLMPCTPRLLH